MNDSLSGLANALPAWLLACVVTLLVVCVVVSLRAPILVKLGVRSIGRRRLRALLVVSGLMLSTMVMVGALGTGDTITNTLQTVVAGSLGTVDEVVVRNPPRGRLRARIQALTEPGFGGLAAAQLDFFSARDIAFLPDAVGDNEAIAGITPAIVEQVTVIHSASHRLRASHPVLALGRFSSEAFGPLVDASGSLVPWPELRADDVVLNVAAADAFGAQAGDQLVLSRNGESWDVRVRAVASNAGIAGAQPLLLAPLAGYQHFAERPEQINALLVANRGGTAGVERSAEAARALRWRLADREVARELHQLLAGPDIQRALRQAEELLHEHDRDEIIELRLEASKPELSENFVSLISEPRTRARLMSLAWRLPGAGARAGRLIQQVSELSVLEVKHEALEQARQYGTVVTTVFLVLGIFSIAAAILLIFLIFALLAADRGAELATLRAIGMRRWQIMVMFLAEGMAYNLAGAVLGAVLGVTASYLLVFALADALAPFGIQLQPYLGLRSLGLAAAGGLLLTFGAMLVAVWRVTRTGIVGGLRGELVDDAKHRISGPTLLLGAAGIVWWIGRQVTLGPDTRSLVAPVAWSLALLGAASLMQVLLRRVGRRASPQVLDPVNIVAAAGVVGIWLRLLLQLREQVVDITNGAVSVAFAGVVLTPVSAWLVVQGLGPLLRMLDVGLGSAPRLRAIVRPVAGYLGQQRSRSGLTVVMFSMVVVIIVATLSLIEVIANAYGHDEPPVAGYDLRAEVRGETAFDMEAALQQAPAVSPEAFDAIGSVATQEVSVVQFGLERAAWRDATLAVVDAGFLKGIQADVVHRAPGFDSAAEVWAALAQSPGTAVVTGQASGGVVLPSSLEQAALEPFTVWVSAQGGQPARLTIIGIIDPRSELEPGIYTSRSGVAGMNVPAPESYFFSLADGTGLRDTAEGLRVSFADQGLVVTVLGEVQRLIRSVRLLLVKLVQGFMGLGLLAGIAALGLLSVQGVLERRQQLATLRALGFTGGHIRTMLIVESISIAAAAVGLGIAVGLLLARTLVGVLATRFSELQFSVPWSEIVVVMALAWLGSSCMTLIAAWQGGRVAPADALRVT